MTTRDYTIIVREEVSGNGFSRAAHDMDRLADSSDRAGLRMKAAGRDLQNLDREIQASGLRIRNLSTQIARGNTSLFGDLRKERRFLADLRTIRREVESVAKVGFSAAEAGVSGLGSAANALPEHFKGALLAGGAAVLVTALPAIGAAISGAVVGTVAGGGIAGGLFAAAHDPAVQAAWGEFTKTFGREAFGADAFVRPTVAALAVLKSAFEDLHIGDTLGKGAGSVRILAEGIGDLARNLMPGLNAVMDKAGPLSSVFATGLSDMGTSISYFLTQVVGSKGTLEGLNYLFKLINATIGGTGDVLRFLGDKFDWAVHTAVKFDNALRSLMIGISTSLPALRPIFKPTLEFLDGLVVWTADIANTGPRTGAVLAGIAAEFVKLAPPIETTTDKLTGLTAAWTAINDEVERSVNVLAASKTDAISFEADLASLAEQAFSLGSSLDITSEAGRRNQLSLIGAARDARQVRDDAIAMGAGLDAANAALKANEDRLLAQAKAAGMDEQAVRDLIEALFAVPTTYGQVASARTFNPNTGLEGRRAAGGPVMAGGAYVVGERGPEVLQMGSRGGYISPDGGGQQVQVVISFAATGDPLLDMFIGFMRKYVRVYGAGNVQTVLGN